MHSVFDVFALIVNIKAYVNMPMVYHVQKDRLQLVLLSMDQLIFLGFALWIFFWLFLALVVHHFWGLADMVIMMVMNSLVNIKPWQGRPLRLPQLASRKRFRTRPPRRRMEPLAALDLVAGWMRQPGR